MKNLLIADSFYPIHNFQFLHRNLIFINKPLQDMALPDPKKCSLKSKYLKLSLF